MLYHLSQSVLKYAPQSLCINENEIQLHGKTSFTLSGNCQRLARLYKLSLDSNTTGREIVTYITTNYPSTTTLFDATPIAEQALKHDCAEDILHELI